MRFLQFSPLIPKCFSKLVVGVSIIYFSPTQLDHHEIYFILKFCSPFFGFISFYVFTISCNFIIVYHFQLHVEINILLGVNTLLNGCI